MAHLLWPSRCVACGALVPEGVAFCEACVTSVMPLGRACIRCASPGVVDPCARCARAPLPLASTHALFAYGGAVADALLRWKHGPARFCGPVLGRLLGPLVARVCRAGIDLVVPVPLHPRRLRQRGFNQALDLAQASLGHARLVGASRPRLARGLLARTRPTAPLGHGSPQERQAAVSGAFSVPLSRAAQDRRILLIDDVLTTGATSGECARTLLEAGACEVHLVTLARAP